MVKEIERNKWLKYGTSNKSRRKRIPIKKTFLINLVLRMMREKQKNLKEIFS
jgi:hypothetical protein